MVMLMSDEQLARHWTLPLGEYHPRILASLLEQEIRVQWTGLHEARKHRRDAMRRGDRFWAGFYDRRAREHAGILSACLVMRREARLPRR